MDPDQVSNMESPFISSPGLGLILDAISGDITPAEAPAVYRTLNVLCMLCIPPSSVITPEYLETWGLMRAHVWHTFVEC